MNKPGDTRKPRTRLRPLADLVAPCLGEVFARRGFAAAELVTHWEDIAGTEVAALCEPMKIEWPRGPEGREAEPATLVLRVDGPAAIEVQHLAAVIVERINRFFGWHAIGRIAIRQAPLTRREARAERIGLDPARVAAFAAALPVEDDALKAALARLGAAVERG